MRLTRKDKGDMSDNVFFEQREDLKKIIKHNLVLLDGIDGPYYLGGRHVYTKLLRILDEDYPGETYKKHPYLKEGSAEKQEAKQERSLAKSYGEGMEIGYRIAKKLNRLSKE